MEQQVRKMIDDWFKQMMEQLTEMMTTIIGNQNRVNPVQRNNNHSNRDVNDKEEEEEYYEEPLFIDNIDDEDEDAVIGDEP